MKNKDSVFAPLLPFDSRLDVCVCIVLCTGSSSPDMFSSGPSFDIANYSLYSVIKSLAIIIVYCTVSSAFALAPPIACYVLYVSYYVCIYVWSVILFSSALSPLIFSR